MFGKKQRGTEVRTEKGKGAKMAKVAEGRAEKQSQKEKGKESQLSPVKESPKRKEQTEDEQVI